MSVEPKTTASGPLVAVAENAIRSWAGDVDRVEADRVLRKWQFAGVLKDAEWVAVLARFPEPVERDPVPFLDYLPEHGEAVAGPERTIFTHCNWIGGCDTPLTAADGSMLCPLHRAAPLSEAMGHYERELRGGAR